ncbi:bacteriohemerythrin [Rhizomicrobium electricum]|jgi:hemerythrin-like metal-binding protein|uniref:Hemerythrin-like domain-containing protein n=1 Tax=Rhizomicrobium electricum TaxID=480070 RepID=A0ABN1EVQ7_9PROT|nr:hemerythrin domain-containing protein [Rhizomicrobium electricum]NIJ49490.1 hemerythrin-like metal-binding protein [Rhizomicrobium electricum]
MDRYDDALALGVESMDSEHRRLAALFDQFVACMKDDGAQGQVRAIVEEALALTNEHFDHEEQLMAETAYPGVDEEKRQHRMLRLKLTTIAGEILNTGVCDQITIANIGEMQKLLYDHMIGPDRDLANYLIAHGIR